ncbi:MAG: aspartate kinase [Candidatus Heimdallarchaeota archaeon]|nr:aspartate kinase [Candidatus Heimdallarchaeota archaeon]
MVKRVVIKFGGASLNTSERIKKAAKMVVNSENCEKIVVVSAMGETTDFLVETMTQIGYTPQDYAEIISMGERTSARIFCSALKSLGAKSIFLDPALENFPIITNSNFIDAIPDVEQTKILANKYLTPILEEEMVPVIGGFIGRDKEGRITTLGRGGSDTTAVLLAASLEAEEIILVKDSNGICSADPSIIPNVRVLKELDIYEMFALSYGGAQVIKAEALRYKLPGQKLAVVDFSSGNLANISTEITGDFDLTTAKIRQIDDLAAVTVVGKINAHVLCQFFSEINDEPFFGISTGQNSVTVFGKFRNVEEIVTRLHNLDCFKALSCRTDIGLIEVLHPFFIDSPGWVAKITSSLAVEGINIIEVTTGKATVNLFINVEDLEEAYMVVRDLFEV